MFLRKIAFRFCNKPQTTTLVPVYARNFVPQSIWSLKLYGPAIIYGGYNIYMQEWSTRNICIFSFLILMAGVGSLGNRFRNNTNITAISLDKLSRKLHINIYKARPDLTRINQIYEDSSFDKETNTLIIPQNRIMKADIQFSKKKFAQTKPGQFVLLIPIQKHIDQNRHLKLRQYLTIDLTGNTVVDQQKVLDEIMSRTFNKQHKPNP